MKILNKDNEMRPNVLTEDKIVDIKILRNYLDNLNLHRTEFKMNKFVVKQKTLKGMTKISNNLIEKNSLFKGKVSIFDSFKQALLNEEKNINDNIKKESFYKSKKPSIFKEAISIHNSSFFQENENKVIYFYQLIFSLKKIFLKIKKYIMVMKILI